MSGEAISVYKQHKEEQVRLYCKKCNVTVCDDCILVAYKEHKIIKLKDCGMQVINELSGDLEEVDDVKVTEICNAISKAKEEQTAFHSSDKLN